MNARHEIFDGRAPETEAGSTPVRTRVKICGITNLDDALASIAAGADLLGFNFYRRSPRFIEPECAREIIAELPASVISVGVFVNEPTPDAVAEIAAKAGVRAVQLHGGESPQFCTALAAWPIIKAFRVSPGFNPADTGRYETAAILLDGFTIQAHGGTGKTFDWSMVRRLPESIGRVFLAGGLGVDNVGQAIAQVRPFGVDACSRLETQPGRKDSDLIAGFIREVRGANDNA